MTAAALLAALDLPAAARVDKRVPKKLVLENGAPTAADKRLINDGIEELFWLASLKPGNSGVAAYWDEAREYLEIAVLRMLLRPDAKALRLLELLQRAVPYPLLVLFERGTGSGMCAAHKRWSLAESGKTVLDGDLITVSFDGGAAGDFWPVFCEALPIGRQPHATLYALYQGWLDALLAVQAARITGSFSIAADGGRAAGRRTALRECARLQAEAGGLRVAAEREKQLARRVELNCELKSMEARLAVERTKL